MGILFWSVLHAHQKTCFTTAGINLPWKVCSCPDFRCLVFVLLQSERPSSKRAKLHTVAASNNGDHNPRPLYYGCFALHIYGCCFSRTFLSW